MTAVACTQPGCGGTIQDGYCDVCGLAPAPAPAAAAPPAGGRRRARGASATRARSPGGAGARRLRAEQAEQRRAERIRLGPVASGPSGSGAWSTGPGQRRQRQRAGTRGSRPGSGRSSRGRLGAGLVEVPPVPALDPAAAVLADPRVPESRRFCGNCGQLVGQSRDGRPGMTEGFCPNCRTRYSFSPKLVPGELVAGQYEVLGCLAHGGLGWIYLARDHNVSDRWVVLKGLLNTGDADAMAAAVAEGRFLAQLEHPNIVRIYNFVQHASRRDGETAGYIVMEYVGGKSLKQIRLDARQRGGAVPLAHALAYALEILPAFGYLHDRGLVYCDFKPDNIIQTEEQLKLIDMGGVRYIDDDGPIYGTVGYQAPEIETEGPSPSSDLYTVGRTLAVLTFDFAGFQGQYRFRLPDNEPLLAAAGVLRAAAAPRHAPPPGPPLPVGGGDGRAADRRAARGAVGRRRPAQARVLRPVQPRAAGHRHRPDPGEPRQRATGALAVPPPPAAEVVAGLPAPLADGTDPAAGYLATLAGLDPAQQAQALLGAVTGDAGVPPGVAESQETRLALVRALIGTGDLHRGEGRTGRAVVVRAGVTGGSPGTAGSASWRAASPTGPGRRSAPSTTSFPASSRPSSRSPSPPRRPATCPRRGTTSSSCGPSTARTSAPASARPGPTSPAATGSPPSPRSPPCPRPQATTPRRRSPPSGCSSRAGPGCPATTCARPTSASAGCPSTTTTRAATSSRWRSCAPRSTGCPAGRPPRGRTGAQAAAERILGYEPNERALRFGLERGYRALANLIPERRVELVDMANSVRPRTWI